MFSGLPPETATDANYKGNRRGLSEHEYSIIGQVIGGYLGQRWFPTIALKRGLTVLPRSGISADMKAKGLSETEAVVWPVQLI